MAMEQFRLVSGSCGGAYRKDEFLRIVGASISDKTIQDKLSNNEFIK